MKLILVGLPLGNIEDISFRAIQTLKEASLIICEDTRVLNKLVQKLLNLGYLDEKLKARLMVLNEFNEKKVFTELVDEIEKEEMAVLVSDAGMPLISDPGFKLVDEVLERDGKIEVVPGPTAAMTALSASGLSADRSLFLGFLPKKAGKRKKLYEGMKEMGKEFSLTAICYESPFRVGKTLIELGEVFGDETKVVVARELTKKYEEIQRGSVGELKESLGKIKGEVVLLWRV